MVNGGTDSLATRNSSVGPFYFPPPSSPLCRDLDNSRIVLSRAKKFTGSTLASLRARFSASGDDAIAAIVILIIRGISLSMIYGAHVVVHVFRKYHTLLPLPFSRLATFSGAQFDPISLIPFRSIVWSSLKIPSGSRSSLFTVCFSSDTWNVCKHIATEYTFIR